MELDYSRRNFLAASAAGTAALAGCLGGNGGSGGNADPEAIDTDDRPALGAASAPVTVTAFEDFGCPSCARFKSQVLPALIEEYVQTGDVRYLHADFPIPVDEEWSQPVANAARGVFEAADNDAFWLFSSAIYEHQGSYSLDAIEAVADDVAEVGGAARTAAENREYDSVIDADRDRGESWGVSGTPSVFVDEAAVDPTYEDIESAIDSRL